MFHRNNLFTIIISALLLLSVTGITQQHKGVLEPENDNEARLNRLQPPGKVMDAVGIIPGMIIAEIGAGKPLRKMGAEQR